MKQGRILPRAHRLEAVMDDGGDHGDGLNCAIWGVYSGRFAHHTAQIHDEMRLTFG